MYPSCGCYMCGRVFPQARCCLSDALAMICKLNRGSSHLRPSKAQFQASSPLCDRTASQKLEMQRGRSRWNRENTVVVVPDRNGYTKDGFVGVGREPIQGFSPLRG